MTNCKKACVDAVVCQRRLVGMATNKRKAEEMGLVDKGDVLGAQIYARDGGADHYEAWSLQTVEEQSRLRALIEAQ